MFGALWFMLHMFGITQPGRWTALLFVGLAIMAAYGITRALSALGIKLGQQRKSLEPTGQEPWIERGDR